MIRESVVLCHGFLPVFILVPFAGGWIEIEMDKCLQVFRLLYRTHPRKASWTMLEPRSLICVCVLEGGFCHWSCNNNACFLTAEARTPTNLQHLLQAWSQECPLSLTPGGGRRWQVTAPWAPHCTVRAGHGGLEEDYRWHFLLWLCVVRAGPGQISYTFGTWWQVA